MTARLTTSTDNFVGTDGDDLFTGRALNLSKTDTIAAGSGTDTLVIESSSATLSYTQFAGVNGIDVLDVTAATSFLRLSVDQHLATQADNGMLLVDIGSNNLVLDTNGWTVKVEGTGTISLEPGAQSVVVSDAAAGTVIGNSKSDHIVGGALDDHLSGAAGTDFLQGGKGDDILTGGANADRFVYSTGDGNDHITDLEVNNGIELIDLRGVTTVSGFGDLNVSQAGADTVIDFGNGDTLTLDNVTAGTLSAHNFVFQGQAEPTEFYIKAGTSAADIQAAIEDAPAGATLHLEAGDYVFDQSVVIDRNDIKVLGAGVGQTNITIAASNGTNATAFVVQGKYGDGPDATLSTTAAAGTNVITLNHTGVVHVGDIIYVSQDNDRAWLDSQGDTFIDTNTPPLREMLTTVTAVHGNQVTVADPLPYTFEGNTATIDVRQMISGVELGGFSVTTDLGTPDKYNYDNTHPEFDGASSIRVLNATNVNLHDISVTDSASHGFEFTSVYNISGSNLSTVGSFNKGPDGNGYGFNFGEAFNTNFTGLVSLGMRHSVLFSSGSAEHYNHLQITDADRDINFHGSPDAGNVITVDHMVLDYDSDTSGNPAVADGAEGHHPNSTIDANTVVFTYLRADGAADVVHGADTGSDLDGGYAADILYGGLGVDTLHGGDSNDSVYGNSGNDFIYGDSGNDALDGGSGNDVVVGGTGRDTMTGGTGVDRFVVSRGDADDLVTDFKAGTGGDVIDLSATGVTSISLLALKQVGADTVVSLGQGDSITLKNVTASALKSTNFQFSQSTSSLNLSIFLTDLGASGGAGNDTFTTSTSFLTDHAYDIYGGAGKDTLVLTSASNFSADTLGKVKGIDVLDLSGQAITLGITINQAFADQADSGQIVIKVGAAGIRLTTTDIADEHDVRIDGTGLVTLNSTGAVVSSAGGAINIAGASGNDTVLGSSYADNITGGGGADSLSGGGGKDYLSGDAGSDYISAGDGSDVIVGGLGNDTMKGGTGTDRYIYSRGDGADTILDFKAGNGGDILDLSSTGVVSTGFMSIRQVGADTVLTFGEGNSIVLKNVTGSALRSSNFIFSTDATGLALTANSADLGLSGTAGDDTFTVSSSFLTDHKYDFLGGSGKDTLVLTSGSGFSAANLGKVKGVDVLDLSAQPNTLTVTLNKAFATQADAGYLVLKVGDAGVRLTTSDIIDTHNVRIDGAGLVTLVSTGGIISSAGGAINVAGSGGADTVMGGDLNDKISGGGANDSLYGGGGKDILNGEAGSDYLSGGDANDVITGGLGNDTLKGGTGSDRFVFGRGDGADTISDFKAGSGGDILDLSSAGVVSLNLLSLRQVGADTVVSLGQGDSIVLQNVVATSLTAANFLFSASATPLTLTANSGDLGVVGGAASDTFTVSSSFLTGHPYDFIGGAGKDSLILTSGSGFSADTLGKVVGIDVLDLSNQANALGVAVNQAFASQADAGYIVIKVGAMGVRLTTSDITDAHNVRIDGAGPVTLNSTGCVVSSAGGAINVIGGSGNDTVIGSDFADTIAGGKGTDILTGGLGADVFIMNTALTSTNVDQITDFQSGQDRIYLDHLVFTALGAGDLPDAGFASNANGVAMDASDHILYSTTTGNLYYDADGNGSGKAILFATLSAGLSLSAHDFWIS